MFNKYYFYNIARKDGETMSGIICVGFFESPASAMRAMMERAQKYKGWDRFNIIRFERIK